ncbi:MmgE/PrpD family protein [Pseudonocardia alaniniphila]|uniref:MmgE/PrpD family protein n=1 Tax=Pseudonocardia alaniniphila TaxID=75291 RepID=A0ABS9TUP1_9PSEU|nr:MmgE/PrpD family protein [Pseudonocardia alaniniphila]MCH6172123.1 MmgE/PrpD family protein [Pseudonocardia alaniniphila]
MVLRRFAEFAVGQRSAGLDAAVRHAATRAVVDWFSATIAGSDMQPASILRSALLDEKESGPCHLVPGGPRASARTAALINATASHTAELDDIFRDGVYHPGSPTVAAALAAAEHSGASGEDFLRAVAVGYEIGDRIAAAIQPAHYTYWHTTGTVGTIGAAAAGAEILGLDAEWFAHALATATTMAAGLQQAFRSEAMSKPLHAGHAAEAGLLAAMTAAHGFTGALDVLDGEAGFGAAMARNPDWDSATEKLGRPWAITQATVKNHSCCGHTFAAVDAALELRSRVRVPEVREIRVATYGAAIKVAGNPDPKTPFEAKFSTAYCVAAAFVLGSVRLQAFTEERLSDPVLRDLVGRTRLAVDPEYDAAFPGQRAARVTIIDKDGTETHHIRNTRKGDPDDPLTDAELAEKFEDLAVPVVGKREAAEWSRALWRLADLVDVRELAAVTLR